MISGLAFWLYRITTDLKGFAGWVVYKQPIKFGVCQQRTCMNTLYLTLCSVSMERLYFIPYGQGQKNKSKPPQNVSDIHICTKNLWKSPGYKEHFLVGLCNFSVPGCSDTYPSNSISSQATHLLISTFQIVCTRKSQGPWSSLSKEGIILLPHQKHLNSSASYREGES